MPYQGALYGDKGTCFAIIRGSIYGNSCYPSRKLKVVYLGWMVGIK